jgi:kynureninase
VHEKHHNNLIYHDLQDGHNKERRFKMEPVFDPAPGAEGWQISNIPIPLAPYLASVEMFDEIGMDA